MHTIKLNIDDSIYSHIMFFLKNLNSQEIEIIEDKIVDVSDSKYDALETDVLSNYSANLVEEWKDPIEDEIWK